MQRSDVKKEPQGEGALQGHKPLKPTLSDVKIEPLIDLAADQVRKEINNTCEMLSISSSEYLPIFGDKLRKHSWKSNILKHVS